MESLSPCRSIQGSVEPPGDKSISHRYAMLGAIAEGTTRLRRYSAGEDCASTLECLRALGVHVDRGDQEVVVHGVGLHGLKPPSRPLDAGNSGTTIRLLSGILAGQRFTSELIGDESLTRRPMRRIIEPLRRMGAVIDAREERYPPLKISGGVLNGIDFRPETPSAQVKSCVLLAGLYADTPTTVCEPVATRDHTEIALQRFGASLQVSDTEIRLSPGGDLQGADVEIPGDISAAMFWILAALILPDSDIRIARVGLNPSRIAVLGLLLDWGAQLDIHILSEIIGEPVGEIRVRYSPGLGRGQQLQLTAQQIPLVIDEIPALAVLGSQTSAGMRIRGAGELRIKESDRLKAVTENLERMGIAVREYPDGIDVSGGGKLRGARLESYRDHRIAMAFAVAALGAEGPSTLADPECVAISYPGFFETLRTLAKH